MSTLSKSLLDLGLNLDENNTAQPAWAIIESYLAAFGNQTVSRKLWEMTVGNLTNDKLFHLHSADNRYHMLYFYEYTVLFVKAVEVALSNRTELQEAISGFDKRLEQIIKKNEEEIARLTKQKPTSKISIPQSRTRIKVQKSKSLRKKSSTLTRKS